MAVLISKGFMPTARVFSLAASVAAAAFLFAAPAPAQENHVFQFALQNGMQVVVVPDHRAPVVTQMLWFRVAEKTFDDFNYSMQSARR